MNKTTRIKWIDTAKFLGIIAIYLGHITYLERFGQIDTSYNKIINFVFLYHVPFFFFLSGCTNNYDNESNFFKYVWKKLKSLMIPFWIFSILSIIVFLIFDKFDIKLINGFLIDILKGNIRNQFIAYPLWFISCLFIMEIMFKLIKYLKNRFLILIICIIIYIIDILFINQTPSLIYNIDSACHYIIYFGLGYVTYPYINKFFNSKKLINKIIFIISGIICLIYSVLIFNNTLTIETFKTIPLLNIIYPLLTALIIIWLNLIISKLIENIEFFSKIGKETLLLCCNEYIVKRILVSLVAKIITIPLNTPCIILYTLTIILFTYFLIIPFEKWITQILSNKKKFST